MILHHDRYMMPLRKKNPHADDEENQDESYALPRFSFEADCDRRPLVSTERLFLRLTDRDTEYDPGQHLIRQYDDDEELIVCRPLPPIGYA